jgi:hypothetical protein
MSRLLSVLRQVCHAVLAPVRWVREGQDDIDGTYPEHRAATAQESATNGSVTTSLTGLGHG